jgi:hypothetical protein
VTVVGSDQQQFVSARIAQQPAFLNKLWVVRSAQALDHDPLCREAQEQPVGSAVLCPLSIAARSAESRREHLSAVLGQAVQVP